ncbi:hypothetical protein EMPS_08708 [Entomortierella parvispora]|uniref:Uncharacterized protein n=1 Tax=Entomortierella parvispora TaxID=205924 RepID=A0A9P3HGK8_9FUNG|nr:hypothetical protein EMPS_08708 [Entomortierella parvispora]
MEIVRTINKFMREFSEFYKIQLGSLFDIMAGQYMMKAFRKAGIEVKLLEDMLKQMGKDLASQMDNVIETESPPYYDYNSINTWIPVEKCIQELFRSNSCKLRR